MLGSHPEMSVSHRRMAPELGTDEDVAADDKGGWEDTSAGTRVVRPSARSALSGGALRRKPRKSARIILKLPVGTLYLGPGREGGPPSTLRVQLYREVGRRARRIGDRWDVVVRR